MNLSRYRLAVFDMDGTLLNTLDDLTDAVNFALAIKNMPPHTIAEVRSFVGNGIRKLIERSVPNGTPIQIIDEVEKDFMLCYSEHCADKTRPYEGVTELLRRLHDRGIKTAIVSNKADAALKSLATEFFGDSVDIAVGESEHIRTKPRPDGVNYALEHLRCDRSEAVYIGDSEVDILTGKNSGVDMISVLWGFRDEDFLLNNGAAAIAHTTQELERMIVGE